MYIIKKKEIIKATKETFTVFVSKKEFDEEKDNIEEFMEEILEETELDIIDIIHRNDKVEIVAEKILEI